MVTVVGKDPQAVKRAEVDYENWMDKITIYCYGTGHEIPEDRNQTYIGTVQNDGLVWHFYWSEY